MKGLDMLRDLLRAITPDYDDHEHEYRMQKAERDVAEREARLRAVRSRAALILHKRRHGDEDSDGID